MKAIPSVLTFHQTKQETKHNGLNSTTIIFTYDDNCRNGYNTFAITGEYRECGRVMACGAIHSILEKVFPEYAHLIKWHLVSSQAPMYYKENGQFWAKEYLRLAGKDAYAARQALKAMRGTVCNPKASPSQVLNASWLAENLENIMSKFKADIEALGFVY